MRYLFVIPFLLVSAASFGQSPEPDYEKLKAGLVAQFQNTAPGKIGPFVKGAIQEIDTREKILALTLDACGGPRGNGYDKELIVWLRSRKIQATLFVGGLWIDAHPDLFSELARDTLFEIENHGLRHRLCSINGRSLYGIRGTENVGQAVDEIELNARKIEHITDRRPVFYRSATATTDEACVAIASALGERIISYDVLSGDAVAGTPAEEIRNNIVKKAHAGAIVIMHMNHPEWNGYEALKVAIPQLQEMGYTFVKLQHRPLKGKH
jgi:peptidoglycan/xylan/chitin deacetylase (PgdA/CDA1 family)